MPETDRPPLPRIVLLAALAVALLALGLYLRTLHPGVGPSLDSMELQIAARVGGVIHPPGSPQYLMLGRLAMITLPGSNPAYRLNLMSALFAAGTVGVVFLLTYRLTHNLVTGSFAALLLAVAPRLWYQASIAELYTLNALYVALVLYLLITWHETRSPAAYRAAVAVYALSFGNHLTMILLLPVFLYVTEITDRSMLLRPRNLALITGIVLAAAMQYLYIPARAAVSPPFCNYCPIPSDTLATNPKELLDYLTGGPFRAQMFTLPRREVLARLPESVEQITLQFMPWGLALGIAGAWELFQRRAEIAWMLVLGLATEYIFVMAYAIPDWHDFLTPVYVIIAPLVGYGALRVWEVLQPQAEALLIRGRTLAGHAYPATLIGVGVLMLIVNLYAYFPAVDQRDETAFEINGHTLLERAEEGALLIMPHPNSPAFYYSWAVRYLALDSGLQMTVIAPPEVDPPPGPPPIYERWADVAAQLAPDAMVETRPQVFVLDRADARLEGWGLLPICTAHGEAVAGYEVVAVMLNGEPVPLVEPERWAAIQSYVVFSDGNIICPPE